MAKRIAAIAGIVVLVGMYAATLVAALSKAPNSMNLLLGSIVSTIIIPIIVWAFSTFYKKAHENDDKQISLSEMKKYQKRIKQGENPEKIAAEIEEKYNIQEEK